MQLYKYHRTRAQANPLTSIKDSIYHFRPHCLARRRLELLEGRLEALVSCLVHAAD